MSTLKTLVTECVRTYNIQMYYCLLMVLLCLLLTCFGELTAKEFNQKLREVVGVDVKGFVPSLRINKKRAEAYHSYCRRYGLNRDYNSDMILLRTWQKWGITNTLIPLKLNFMGTNYMFTYNGHKHSLPVTPY